MNNDLVTVATFLRTQDAEMARGYLEANGVEVFLRDREMARIQLPSIIGGIKLQVRAEDAETARELLSQAQSEPGTDEGEES